MRNILSILLVIFFVYSCSSSSKDDPEVIGPDDGGKTFKREITTKNYIEYRTGNYPIIFTVPHGGVLTDDGLIIRTEANCPDPDFTIATDTYTIELANLIDSVFYARTGKYPYMIIGKIRRKYVDLNRAQNYAIPASATQNKEIYTTFHNYVRTAVNALKTSFNSGLIVDIHGHGHAKKEIEIGYLLTKADLNLTDEQLAANSSYLQKCSICNLARNNKSNSSFAGLIRGQYSLGSIMEKNGLACIPNSSNLSPGNTPYFNGGYNTKTYGSANGASIIDGVQLEFDSVSRKKENRKNTAINLYNSLEEFMKKHYNLAL